MRVPGPGAPAAAWAPAVTESILAQVVATSSGIIATSRRAWALATQAKKPGCSGVRQRTGSRRLREDVEEWRESRHVRELPCGFCHLPDFRVARRAGSVLLQESQTAGPGSPGAAACRRDAGDETRAARARGRKGLAGLGSGGGEVLRPARGEVPGGRKRGADGT